MDIPDDRVECAGMGDFRTRTVHDALTRATLAPGWIALSALTLLYAGVPFLSRETQPFHYLAFAFVLPIVGLPHGAVDHLVPSRLPKHDVSVRTSIIAVVLLYAVLSTLYLALWLTFPRAAFAVFIAIAWLHWGQADLFTALTFLDTDPRASRPRTARCVDHLLAIVVRGGLPVAVPLLAFPHSYTHLAGAMVALFRWTGEEIQGTPLASGAIATAAMLTEAQWRTAGGALFVTLFALAVARASRTEAAELILLAAFFTLVPPVLAIGVYFGAWHSLRHIARLMLLEPHSRAALNEGSATRASLVFFKDAAPLTVVSFLGLAALFVFLGVTELTVAHDTLLAASLVFVSLVTLPHVVVVAFMDWVQLPTVIACT